MAIPAEIRMMIYQYLLDNDGKKTIAIRNRPRRAFSANTQEVDSSLRSKYHVLERSIVRRSYETTYGLAGPRKMHPAIMAVNRQIREEASHYLYGKHSFHFARDLEAVVPFFFDKTTCTLEFVQEIVMHKRLGLSTADTDSGDWAATCRFLKVLPNLSKLKLVMEGSRPRGPWDGPQELSVSDLRFLYATRHECLEWARELAELDMLEQVEITTSSMYPVSEPQTHSALVYAAFANSIETSLVDFLRSDLKIPAIAVSGG
jgi:hypothetical protein